MTNDEQLVQLSRGPARACPVSGIRFGTLADKFFLVGAFAGLAGIGWMGAHLWLALNGQIAMKPAYVEIRRLHVLVQIYLFLGMFVLGFVAQAGPRLMGSKRPPSPFTLIWIPALIAGVLAWHFAPTSLVGRTIVSAVFASALAYATMFQLSGEPFLRRTTGRFILCGLVVFAVSPLLPLEQSSAALFFFWAGLAPLIAGTGQQFVAAFLGGRRSSEYSSAFLLILIVLTAGGIALGAAFEREAFYRVAGLGAALSTCCYIVSTQLYRAWRTALRDALALSFLVSYGWALLGGVMLCLRGSAAADLVVHLWAIGWATPLIFTVSGQIMGYMSGRNVTSTPRFIAAILCWQVVPVGRSLLDSLALPAAFSWAVSISATAVLIFWCYELIAAERLLLGRMQSARVNHA